MGLFGQSKNNVLDLIDRRDNGWLPCEKCGHLIRKSKAVEILSNDSTGRAVIEYYGKSCKPAYDRKAYMPGGAWYFKKAETAHDTRVNEDGSSYYETMGERYPLSTLIHPTDELHTAACREHCTGPACPCDGCKGLFSKEGFPFNMNDARGHRPSTSSAQGMEGQHAIRLLKKFKAHVEEMEQSWTGSS